MANYSRGGTTPISWSPACTCINSVAIDLSRGSILLVGFRYCVGVTRFGDSRYVSKLGIHAVCLVGPYC